MKTVSVLSVALLAGTSVAHVAIKPPSPDRWLTPNSSTAPPGCKLLASDKGFPTEEEVLKEFPTAFRKLKGTEGPDFWIQPSTVEDVQKAVNFARERNIRLNIITTGHDFHGREDQRSGLRLDMAGLVYPTVFSNDWKCGTTLKPKVQGRDIHETFACKIPSQKQNVGRGIAARNWDWLHFEKRDGQSAADCNTIVKRHLKKRHGPDAEEEMGGHGHAGAGAKVAKAPEAAAPPPVQSDVKFDTAKPWEWGQKTGFQLPASAQIVDSFNKITLTGKHAYARIPGGMYNEKLFTQAAESGLMSLGAQHGGVSTLGGWMQAGGHNPFANVHGMMVDNVVELEVVTPDGKFQKASACENQDLFWALRGGGGSTFGVVTGGTVKVYPTFPVTVSRFFVNVTEPYDPKIFKAVAHFLQRGTQLREKYGFQGYFYVYPNGFHSVLHHPNEFAKLENAKKGVAEIQGEMEKIAGGKHIEPQFFEHKTYKEWYVAEMGDEEMEETGQKARSWYDGSWGDAPSSEDVMMNPMLMVPFKLANAQREAKEAAAKEGKGKLTKRQELNAAAAHTVLRSQPMGRTYLDSRLLSDKQVNSVSLDALAEVVDKTFPRVVANHVRGFLYGGGAQAKPAKDAMGLLPDWRDMTYHYIINALPGDTRHDFNIRAFDTLFPDAGGYVNEASPEEPNWKKKYWGAHYEKLEAFKKKIDPQNVLWCSPCVGADLLTYDDERLCKNPNYPQAGPSPQTYPDPKSKTGIASLPGRDGIPNPLNPIIQGWMQNKTIPSKMPASGFFKIAMGQGGSSGGRWATGEPKAGAPAPMEGMHGGHGDMGAGESGAESTSSIPTDPPANDAPPAEEAPKAAESAAAEPAAEPAAPVESAAAPEPATPAPTAATEASASAEAPAATPSDAGPVVEATPKTSKGKSSKGKSSKGKGKSSKSSKGKSSKGLGGMFGKGKASSKTSKTNKSGSRAFPGLLGINRVELEEIERTVVPSSLL